MTTSFRDFGLRPELLQAVDEAGFVSCTPIQAGAIGPILEGRDLTGLALDLLIGDLTTPRARTPLQS